ncbi:MAG: hypothetical protein KAJ51_14915 [Thermoplasmata archaeon]|nr:hypothetical protein [Thermoplasmata archaeon]
MTGAIESIFEVKRGPRALQHLMIRSKSPWVRRPKVESPKDLSEVQSMCRKTVALFGSLNRCKSRNHVATETFRRYAPRNRNRRT